MSDNKKKSYRNFTPYFDGVREFYLAKCGQKHVVEAVIHTLVYGAIRRHCEMRNGVCYASQSTLAAMVGISRQKIGSYILNLIQDGFVDDTTPDVTGRTHTLKVTGRADLLNAGTVEPVTSCDTLPVTGGDNLPGNLSQGVTGGVTGGDTKKQVRNDSNQVRKKEETNARQKPGRGVLLESTFCDEFRLPKPSRSTIAERRAAEALWDKPLEAMLRAIEDVTPEDVPVRDIFTGEEFTHEDALLGGFRNVLEMTNKRAGDKNTTIANPKAAEKTFQHCFSVWAGRFNEHFANEYR